MRWYLTGRKEPLANRYRDRRNVQPVSRQETTGKDRLMYPRYSLDKGCKSTTSNLKPWVALWLTLTRFCCLRTAFWPALKGNPGDKRQHSVANGYSGQTWVEIGDAKWKILSRLFLLLRSRALRRYQGCNACTTAMLASETSVKSTGVEKKLFRSMIFKIKARFDYQT